jgi:hypothetical protein
MDELVLTDPEDLQIEELLRSAISLTEDALQEFYEGAADQSIDDLEAAILDLQKAYALLYKAGGYDEP